MTHGRRRRREAGRWLLFGGSVAVAVAIIGALAIAKLSPKHSSSSSGGSQETTATGTFAPYVDLTAPGRPTLAEIAKASGADALHASFVIPTGDESCSLAWDGQSDLDQYTSELKQAEADGVGIIVTLGGEAGADFAQTCSDASSAQAQLQKLMDLGIRSLDFDIEGEDRLSDDDANQIRADALAALQKKYSNLQVSFTLGAAAPKTSGEDQGVADPAPWQAAVDAGVKVGQVNVMTMDYGGKIAASDMGAAAIASATGLHEQIEQIQGLSSADAWKAVGITPMIGINDEPDEVFSLDDAKRVVDFATENGVGMLAYWSALRDQQCADGSSDDDSQTSDTCRGVDQSAYAFAELFSGDA
jgi:chitinase